MKNKVFLMLTLSILVLSLNSHGVSPPGTIFPKDVPRDYPEPVEIHIVDASINDIQYSPDGKLLAVGANSGIYLYNTQTLGKVYHIENAGGTIRIAFSSDGRTLASCRESHDTIDLWDVATGTHKQALTTHSKYVTSIAFSPDGQTLASGGVEGYFILDGKLVSFGGLRLWDVTTGSLLHNFLTGREQGVTGVSFSPDGKILASSSYDATIRLLDVQTGNLLHTITTGRSEFEGVVFSPDGKKIASWTSWYGIFLWDVSTGSLLHKFSRLTSDTDYLFSIAFSPNGCTIASTSAAAVRLWDVSTGTYLHSLRESHNLNSRSVAFSPNGRTLASGSHYRTILLWDIASSQLPEDINRDGVVNIQDLVAVAQAFGTAEPDLNGDGVVNILDLVMVANAFGNTVSAPEE